MGNCAERKASSSDMSSFTSNKNNSFFFSKPSLEYLSIPLSIESEEKLTKTLIKIKQHLKYLNSYLPAFTKSRKPKTQGRLIIEVQKALLITYISGCLGDIKPCIKAEIQPMNHTRVTHCANRDCPAWFELLVFKEDLTNLERVCFKLHQNDDFSNKAIDQAILNIDAIDDQEVFEGWIKMENNLETKLYVRVQMIRDSVEYYEKNLEYIRDNILKLKEAFFKCRLMLGATQTGV